MNNVSGYGIEFLERYIDIVKDYISLAEKYEMDDKGKIEEEALRFAKIVTGYELGITSSLKEEVEEEVEEEADSSPSRTLKGSE